MPLSVVQSIFTAMPTCIKAITPATDADAPSTYEDTNSLESLMQLPGKRLFTVELGEHAGLHIQGTGTAGYGRAEVGVRVIMRFRNDGRSSSEFEAILAEELWRVSARILAYYREGNVAGVQGIRMDQPITVGRDEIDNYLYFPVLNFIVTFADTLPSS